MELVANVAARQKRLIKATTASRFMSSCGSCLIILGENPCWCQIDKVQHYSCSDSLCIVVVLSIASSIPAPPPLPPSGGCSASFHDPEECVDVIALDGVSAGRDHLVFGLADSESTSPLYGLVDRLEAG